jgi:hypothetical protein
MCLPCWRRVPKDLQREVYRHYRKGQEIDKDPSEKWLEAAKAAIKSLSNN